MRTVLTVSTGVLLRRNDDLQCVNFPNLETLDGHLGVYAHDNAKLRMISFPKLTTITANTEFDDYNGINWFNNALLEEIDLSSLTYIAANRNQTFSNNPLLHTVRVR